MAIDDKLCYVCSSAGYEECVCCDGAPWPTGPDIVTMEDFNKVGELMTLFETRLDSLEEIVATLVLAQSETSAAVEVSIAKMMEPASEEEKREFRNQLKAQHVELLRMMQDINYGVEPIRTNPESAVEEVDGEQPPPPTE